MQLITTKREICPKVLEKGSALVAADEFSIAPELDADRRQFWADWESLVLDKYLKKDARFRRRRYGTFYWLPKCRRHDFKVTSPR